MKNKMIVIPSVDKGWNGHFALVVSGLETPDICFASVTYSMGGEGLEPFSAENRKKSRAQAKKNALEIARRWNKEEGI